MHKFYEAGVPICNWTAVLNCGYLMIELYSINLICQFASLFDDKFNSGRILWMNREQQDVPSFAEGNLRHKLDLPNWRVN